MKYAPLLALLTFAIAPKAHAIHAYHSNWCHEAQGRKLPFQLRSNYDWIEATPNKQQEGDSSSLDGSIVDAAKPLEKGQFFLAKETKVTNEKKEDSGDECWSGTRGSYDAVMQILVVSPKAAALGLKAGMEVSVHCETEDLDPDGTGC